MSLMKLTKKEKDLFANNSNVFDAMFKNIKRVINIIFFACPLFFAIIIFAMWLALSISAESKFYMLGILCLVFAVPYAFLLIILIFLKRRYNANHVIKLINEKYGYGESYYHQIENELRSDDVLKFGFNGYITKNWIVSSCITIKISEIVAIEFYYANRNKFSYILEKNKKIVACPISNKNAFLSLVNEIKKTNARVLTKEDLKRIKLTSLRRNRDKIIEYYNSQYNGGN